MNQRLRPEQRIRGRFSFQTVFNKGIFRRGEILNLWVFAETAGLGIRKTTKPKLGVVVSRRVSSKAVERNLWKRKIREAFRQHQGRMTPGVAVVIQARSRKKVPEYAQIKTEMMNLLAGLGVIS